MGASGGRYPSASSEPLESFRGLRTDLRVHCGEFLRGSEKRWREVAERALQDPRPFTITHEFLRLEDTRRAARGAFAAHDFVKVVALYEPLEKLLMPAERRRLEIARERVRTGRGDGW